MRCSFGFPSPQRLINFLLLLSRKLFLTSYRCLGKGSATDTESFPSSEVDKFSSVSLYYASSHRGRSTGDRSWWTFQSWMLETYHPNIPVLIQLSAKKVLLITFQTELLTSFPHRCWRVACQIQEQPSADKIMLMNLRLWILENI